LPDHLKTSLGIWAMGGMVTRFVPVGYQPEHGTETTAQKVRRAVEGLGDLIDDYEFHYPAELAPDTLDEVREALDGHGIYAVCAGLHLDPQFGRGGLVSPDPQIRELALRRTLDGARFAGEIGAHFIVWPGIEGYNSPFQAPYRESWRWLIEGVESGEAPRRYADGSATGTTFVQVGYLATDTITGLSVYHPGDLHETFPAMEQLRGKVQIMCYPLGKTRAIETEVVDLIRPRWLVPIHYRLDEPGFPIPFDVDASALTAAHPTTGARLPGASDEAYARDMATLMRGHWYPTPEDPLTLIEDIQRRLGHRATFVTLRAGERYAVDTETGGMTANSC